jgi:NADH-quinone oxidoreductase subunit M
MILLVLVWALPLLAAFGVRKVSARPARALAILTMAVTAGIAGLLSTTPRVEGWLAADGLSGILLLLCASVALVVLVAAPRVDLGGPAVGDLLLGAGATLAALVARNVMVFALAWVVSTVPLYLEARRRENRALARAFAIVTVCATLPMVGGLVVLAVLARGTPLEPGALSAWVAAHPGAGAIAPVLLVAAAARAGLFPFHMWIPATIENARVPIAAPVALSSLGSFAFGRILLGIFPARVAELGEVIVACATVSAVYGALLTLGRNNARRQLGYLWVSVVGFVFVGFGAWNPESLSGSLLYDLASVLALTGLLVIVVGVEARAGTADMRRLGGIVRTAPRFATGYLLLGLAVVCFPGTAGFISEDLLVEGLHHHHPALAVLLLLATAANGISLVRSFKRIFLGTPRGPGLAIEDMLVRERWVSAILVIALLLGGLVPTPLLHVRHNIVDQLQRQR